MSVTVKLERIFGVKQAARSLPAVVAMLDAEPAEPVVLTRRGKPVAVLIHPDEWQRQEQEFRYAAGLDDDDSPAN